MFFKAKKYELVYPWATLKDLRCGSPDLTRPDLPKAVFKVFETIDAFEETGNPVAIVRRSNDSSMI